HVRPRVQATHELPLERREVRRPQRDADLDVTRAAVHHRPRRICDGDSGDAASGADLSGDDEPGHGQPVADSSDTCIACHQTAAMGAVPVDRFATRRVALSLVRDSTDTVRRPSPPRMVGRMIGGRVNRPAGKVMLTSRTPLAGTVPPVDWPPTCSRFCDADTSSATWADWTMVLPAPSVDDAADVMVLRASSMARGGRDGATGDDAGVPFATATVGSDEVSPFSPAEGWTA